MQIGLLAAELGITSLKRLAFDGTRIKANNRRNGSRSPKRLREMQQELRDRFAELQAQAEQEDAADDEQFGQGAPHRLPDELAEVERRRQQIAGALAELEKFEAADEEPPKRIPLTDPDARISPNKDGGFAPNYTPLAGVDVESGLIVTEDVINHVHEEHHLVEAVEQVAAQFDKRPEEVLADGLFGTGANLAALEDAEITMYSPCSTPDPQNPARRDDPTQPVPVEQHDQLPTSTAKNGGGEQLDRTAFVYDEAQDTYWCPQGKPLPYRNTTSQTREDGTRVHRKRYHAETSDCLACVLRERCLSGKKAQGRQLSRDQFEPHRERLAERMASDEGKQKYGDRRSPGERPFAVIKQVFGARQFLLRGLSQVQTEWRWLVTAFNVKQLIQRYAAKLLPRPGPATETVAP